MALLQQSVATNKRTRAKMAAAKVASKVVKKVAGRSQAPTAKVTGGTSAKKKTTSRKAG